MVADLPVGENLQDHVHGDGVELYTPYTGLSISMAHADSFFSTWMYSLFGTGKRVHTRYNKIKFVDAYFCTLLIIIGDRGTELVEHGVFEDSPHPDGSPSVTHLHKSYLI